MTFQSIKLIRFRCHDKEEVEFSPGVTTIIGKTGSGKSAIIQGLRWICLNLPRGSSYISHGNDSCSARLVFDDRKLSRIRGTGTNIYRVGKDETYHAVGSSVPQPVSDSLNVGPINFQRQHDPPFWFSLTPGEVSRELNGIINLSSIDNTLSKLSSLARNARANESLCEQRLETAKQEEKRLAWVKKASIQFDRIQAKKQALEETRLSSRTIAEQLKVVQRLADDVQNAAQARTALLKLVAKAEALQELRKRAEKLQELLQKAKELKQLTKVKIPASVIAKLVNQAQELENLKRDRDKLLTLLQRAQELEEERCQTQKELEVVKSKLKGLMKKSCPLCGK